ncbi:3-methyladenine DNA glycosylase [Skermania sp. ID1734]|uniref:3-methyladenine DNA glycosylase n=1 Tax=Skermania sp. ID1734 TaxID=2597516 RepID=UPI001180D7F5|nr:3-methyladenine DNA glycosylase [Skermania sp. ID1734]TSE01414.1 3-methyladenine DNA glycosylase [Skermania sp. ID1734]
MTVLPRAEWTARGDQHRERVHRLLGGYSSSAQKHPVIDFLFTYYSYRPTQLLRWHPGYGIVLADADEYAGRRGYHRVDDGFTVDPAFVAKRRETIEYIAALLTATAQRPAHLACFGLHEWAMVYRSTEIRHRNVELRLGRAGTDAVVESMPLRCTHYDAYRFFTPDAAPLNAQPLTRADQVRREQPGCLHASMDLYKWCYKLAPMVESSLTVDCFELALQARALDMRASPYDLSELGYEPVRIETAPGRAQYVREQSAISGRARALRDTLLTRCRALLA